MLTIARYMAVSVAAVLLAFAVAQAEEVTFTFVPPEDASVSSVSVRGTFNNWGETAMEQMEDGSWSVTLDLDPGEYEYKYFINGQWPQDMEIYLDGYPADPEADYYVDDTYGGQNAVREVGGGRAEQTFEPPPDLPDDYARIHYHRPRGGYMGWGLHAWEDADVQVEWTSPLEPTGQDEYGLYWDVKLKPNAKKIGFIVHKGDMKDPGPDMFLTLDDYGREIWLVSGSSTMHTEEPDVSMLAFGNLARAQAHWLDRSTIGWKVRPKEGDVVRLHSSKDAKLEITAEGVVGGKTIELTHDPNGLPAAVKDKFPHLRAYQAFKLPEAELSRVPELLKGQVAVSITSAEGQVKDATGLQIPGVLDDLFTYDGPLGVQWDGGVPTISVWAPTAQGVRFHLFDSADADAAQVLGMTSQNGVWSITGEPNWKNKYYLYEIKVFHPATGAIERYFATDPYSRSLSMNSARTQIVDLDDPALKPEGWDALEKPALDAPEDIVLYELHIRDFSASDPTVPDAHVGTYMAFADETNGTRHLRSISEAGITHVHLLPAFDIASVNEDKSTWQYPGDLSQYPPDSDQQQAAVSRISGSDPYNWGYDPFHYGVPEGSYSTDPDGSTRILEFRRMVMALSDMGLRTVMDVVYNHTNASGLADKSVLDKVVPGYYHRLNSDGFVETSTCCQNTATEYAMMERLMIDDLVHWAVDYKVDGFRFDLMGHHMKRNMEKARDQLHALTPEKDGVDGKTIYLYGEGWDFGEVQGGERGINATQFNMSGTGIGTFNDRIRDAVRGGTPFSDRREQGFATGLYYQPNGFNSGDDDDRDGLRIVSDIIRIGMAGNLRNYVITDMTGNRNSGWDIFRAGYTMDPQEALSYASAHDNETLFDKIQYSAAPAATLAERVRMQNLAISVVALGQSIPFFHAGTEILRSKSMDADSYNSGDWFNKLDWSYEMNNFGVGLPVAEKNYDRWNIIRPLLSRQDITPGKDAIMAVLHHFEEMLMIRKSSPLFRLRTADDIMSRVQFHNTGRDQIPGLIVMSISDKVQGRPDLDPEHESIVAIINATDTVQEIKRVDWMNIAYDLHPILKSSHDQLVRQAGFEPAKGMFAVPARTAAVFVEK